MRSLTVILLIAATTHSSLGSTLPAQTVRGNTLRSTSLPAITIQIDEAFRYVGPVPFTIRDVAAGHRYVFVDAEGMKVNRLFVAQFEGWLPGVNEIYRYDFSRARDIGGYKWRHNIYWYSVAAAGNEAKVMHDWLDAKGYKLDDELVMSRFLTLGDETRKSELILFYMETARANGVRLAELDADERRSESFARGLEERSLAAFRIVP